jgi:hypothetical protein
MWLADQSGASNCESAPRVRQCSCPIRQRGLPTKISSSGTSSTMFSGQVLVGLLISLVNIPVHAVIMALLSWTAHHSSLAVQAVWLPIRLALVMMAAVTVLMTAYLIEIITWGDNLRSARCGPGPNRCVLFCLCELYYARLWRHSSSRALATSRPNGGHERRIAIWMVHCCDLRRIARCGPSDSVEDKHRIIH